MPLKNRTGSFAECFLYTKDASLSPIEKEFSLLGYGILKEYITPNSYFCLPFFNIPIGAIFVDTGRNFENSKKIIIDGFYDGKIKNILEKHQTDMNSNLENYFNITL